MGISMTKEIKVNQQDSDVLTTNVATAVVPTIWDFEVIQDKESFFREKASEIQVFSLLRSPKTFGLKKIVDIASSAQTIIDEQCRLGIFPYERYIERKGHEFEVDVHTPFTSTSTTGILWCTNLYLGLNNNELVKNRVKEAVEKYGTGSGTSAVSGGFSNLHKQLESNLAKFVGKEEVVLYPTGFTTNLGAISSLAKLGDLLIMDKECHACIIDGAKLSGAEIRAFKHNDVAALEKYLISATESKKYNNIIVLIESVYSMTGGEAHLEKICLLKNKYDFYLLVDEAHAFGFYGKHGNGLVAHLELTEKVDFVMSTLSKSTASVGGFIATTRKFATYLRYLSDTYLFQATMTPPDTVAALTALEIIENGAQLRSELWNRVIYFRNKLIEMGFNVGESKSPIVPIYISEDKLLFEFCKRIFENGIFTNTMQYPAVRKREGRLRFIVTMNHSYEAIDKTLRILNEIGQELGVI